MSEDQYKAAAALLRSEVETWRRGKRNSGGQIPGRFWDSGVALVKHFSAERVSVDTGLHVAGLEKRIAAYKEEKAAPSFMELVLPAIDKLGCVIKLETPAGARLQLEVNNLDATDLSTVIIEISSSWRRASGQRGVRTRPALKSLEGRTRTGLGGSKPRGSRRGALLGL